MVSKTGIGIGNGIPFGNNNSGGDRPYLSPELKSRLRIVAYTYGKRNGDADRATIRNLVDPDNPLICHNFAWIPNSGYGFTTNYVVNPKRGDVEVLGEQHWLVKSVAQEEGGAVRQCINTQARYANFAGYTFNIKCSNIKDTDSVRIYYGYNKVLKLKNGDNIVTYEAMPTTDNYYVFDFNKEVENIEIKVEPIMQDALVTDGVSDIIIATKTAGEMFADMGNETAISFVSKFHLIDYKSASFNNLRNPTDVTGRNLANKDRDITRKDIIIGWTKENINNNNSSTLISGILGDDADYIASGGITLLNDQKFSPVGYIGSVSNVGQVCKIAYEWTIGGIGTFTEDDINQIIAYYNLDRTLKSDIYCNIKKQGITNENHAEFSDKLIDFSGNGRDIQLNNIAWNKESGIDDNGALRLDGVNDFGKVTGMPVYKDYTVVAKYQRLTQQYASGIGGTCCISKSYAANQGAFIMDAGSSSFIKTQCYSFGQLSPVLAIDNSNLEFHYQTKYIFDKQTINTGEGIDSDTLWLGLFRDNDTRFFNGAIYSLMSFPYSMSEFLIERQLKKHKLGTLYPNMVELRPIIKSNINILKIDYFDKDWNVLHIGDYVSIGNDIKTNITVPDGYKISKATSDALDNITILKSSIEFIYDVKFYGIKKSPQKINLVIEQDSDYVQWNPNIKANVSKYAVSAYFRKIDGTALKLVNGQFYSTSITGDLILDIVPPYKDSDEVTNVVIDGKSYTPTKDSSGNYYRLKIPLVFPKEINITIQEYVRYEDIVQPYPVLLRFRDENGNEVSWGGKVKLGSSITRISPFNDCNLLKDIYTVSNAKLNGNPLTSTPHVVERQMVFTCTATWIFDDNEPNCILSPRLLHAPNSSYKILGYIPDISGHGNHGVIHNSAYGEGSGVNEDGSYQFDGVDDFVTIPTATGGKQVLMKVNWQSIAGTAILYDQRTNGGFAIFNRDYDTNENKVPAYRARNIGGNTYIEGILSKYIYASQLQNITHNIVELYNPELNIGMLNPKIGSSYLNSNYAQMSLYDFMLFDNVSTDDKIKELNEYVGTEAKEGLLHPSITVNDSYVVLNTVEDTNDYLVNGTATCGIGFSDESASKEFITGVIYDKNFSYAIIVIANNNKELISLSHNGVSADSIQSIDYSETTKLYICSTTNGMFAVGSAPQEIIIELSD